jgi:hypothetical protein
MIRSRLLGGLCVGVGIAAALGAGWLIWQAPHCRPVAARAYYTPPAHVPAKACPGLDPGWTPVRRQEHAQMKEAAQCGRNPPRSAS